MAREGLRADLSSAIFRANSEKKPIVHQGVRIKYDGGFRLVNLTVAPLNEPGIPPGYLIIVFQESGLTNGTAKSKPSTKGVKREAELEQELDLAQGEPPGYD